MKGAGGEVPQHFICYKMPCNEVRPISHGLSSSCQRFGGELSWHGLTAAV